MLTCLIYYLWIERNARIHRAVHIIVEQLVNNVLNLVRSRIICIPKEEEEQQILQVFA